MYTYVKVKLPPIFKGDLQKIILVYICITFKSYFCIEKTVGEVIYMGF